MSAKEKPFCQMGPKWVADRIARETGDKAALAPLTSQDARAFSAFFHLVALYGGSDEAGRNAAVAAMYHTLRAMQPKTRYLAKAGIPSVLDWSHEAEIWRAISEYANAILGRADSEPPQWMFERAGVEVVLLRDSGERLETVTRSVPWQLGHGQWVIAVDGLPGGYDVARVSRR